MVGTFETFRRTSWRDGHALTDTRALIEETAVALSYNGSTHAVLMSTPADLEDLAVGFSVTEGIVDSISEIEEMSVVEHDLGLDVQVRIRDNVAERLAARRRSMAGPVGCGMCGLESLEAVMRSIPSVQSLVTFMPSEITAAVRSIEPLQDLNRKTAAAHAAGFFVAGEKVGLVREDVGRHNALDKLVGALLRSNIPASVGGIVMTSRVSVELVQKTAMAGCGLLAAISAPTAFAVRTAQAANITLAAVARAGSFEVFSRPDRLLLGAVADVA